VAALPAPAPAPLPMPKPVPQGVITDPITGLLGSFFEGAISLGSLQSAVPAVISDTAQVLDSAGAVVRMFSHSLLGFVC
jgi:hypothetical protein